MIKKIITTAYVSLLVFFPLMVRGEETGTPILEKAPGSLLSKGGIKGAYALITKAGGWLSNIIIALAVVFIIYGGFVFVTAGGDEEKIKSGRGYVLWGVIGLVVATVATGIVFLVGQLLGAPAK